MYTSPKVEFKNFNKKDKSLFFCNFCGFPHVSYEDFNLSEKWDGACHECYLTFIESRKLSWKEGWRPDKETLEEYIYNRKKLLQEKK
tara:strand:- start:39 stop:299 length:261 start_codon:yes stop_codon:yes gene_type:complete